jgi:hypothetical protein
MKMIYCNEPFTMIFSSKWLVYILLANMGIFQLPAYQCMLSSSRSHLLSYTEVKLPKENNENISWDYHSYWKRDCTMKN